MITKNGAAYSATIAAGTANSLTLPSELDVLDEGSIVYFEKNGTRGTAAGSFTKTDTQGQFAVGMPTGYNTRVSPLVNTDTLKYSKTIYQAAAGMVGILGDDAIADRTTGAFAASDVGVQFVCTVASSGGDFASELIDDLTGVAISGELVLGQTYTVFAAGTPTWGSGTLVSTITNTLVVGTKVVGGEYGYDIIDLEKDTWERRIENISLTLTSASTTDAQMIAALVAAHNAHPKASLIATAEAIDTDKGIKFTSVTAGSKFKVLAKGLLYGTGFEGDGAGASIVATPAIGSNAQLLDLEVKAATVEGKTGTSVHDQIGHENPIYKVPTLVETGQNYTMYVLTWTDQREVAYPSNNANPNHKRLEIAVPSGDSTMIAAMDNLLADLGVLDV